ncbi:hypothetical protein VNO77_39530 [Canavalia gladiata]|uniref:Uncharacterized protein n=1 Tax=Canavalia gladiata TaxID=3824 RepID=A0AAN9PYB7_CANGL
MVVKYLESPPSRALATHDGTTCCECEHPSGQSFATPLHWSLQRGDAMQKGSIATVMSIKSFQPHAHHSSWAGSKLTRTRTWKILHHVIIKLWKKAAKNQCTLLTLMSSFCYQRNPNVMCVDSIVAWRILSFKAAWCPWSNVRILRAAILIWEISHTCHARLTCWWLGTRLMQDCRNPNQQLGLVVNMLHKDSPDPRFDSDGPHMFC